MWLETRTNNSNDILIVFRSFASGFQLGFQLGFRLFAGGRQNGVFPRAGGATSPPVGKRHHSVVPELELDKTPQALKVPPMGVQLGAYRMGINLGLVDEIPCLRIG